LLVVLEPEPLVLPGHDTPTKPGARRPRIVAIARKVSSPLLAPVAVTSLTGAYRALLGEQGFVLVYRHPSEFAPEPL
jgi:hypothetical protein